MGNNITERLKYKESVVKFSYKYGVTKAAIHFCECKRTIYRWQKKYDGKLKSLADLSRRPHYHPNQHTKEEIKLIQDYKRNNKETGLVVLWVKLRKAGYTRTIQGLYHVMQRLGIYKKAPSKRKSYEPSEWITGNYPGEKVQIDVKYFPFKIKIIQTDNGFEFTNRLSWQAFLKNKKTLFEKTLEELGLEYKLIKPHTPKLNGRVERSHRKDQERFYRGKIFYSLEDLRNRGKDWRKEYNNFPMRPLGWLSPNEFIRKYKCQVESL